MATQDLIQQGATVDTSKDNVIIQKLYDTVPGGRTLETTGFPDSEIRAGHVVLHDGTDYVPQPVDGSIPVGSEVIGVLYTSILKSEPEAAIMTRGIVDEVQLKYPITEATKTALTDRISYNVPQ